MTDPADARNRALIKAIEDHGREIRDLRRSIENAAKKDDKKTPDIQVFNNSEAPAPVPTIHLAFMEPNDPRPTCWNHTGIGGRFTMTNNPDFVTCNKCQEIMAQNT